MAVAALGGVDHFKNLSERCNARSSHIQYNRVTNRSVQIELIVQCWLRQCNFLQNKVSFNFVSAVVYEGDLLVINLSRRAIAIYVPRMGFLPLIEISPVLNGWPVSHFETCVSMSYLLYHLVSHPLFPIHTYPCHHRPPFTNN